MQSGAQTHLVEIHPTRRCNLRCTHCASSSSPRAREAIDGAALARALDDLAAEDYRQVSFAGGEALLYKPLPTLLARAHRVGLDTTVVSNGMLMSPERLDAIERHTDLLLISLDGRPETHNRLRNSPKAFEAMLNRLPDLQSRELAFGFRFTLTRHNLSELPWVAEFALNMGATTLQVRPLAYPSGGGRAVAGMVPGPLEVAQAWELLNKLQTLTGERMDYRLDRVQLQLTNHRIGSRVPFDEQKLRGPLGACLSPLVIEPDGSVVPGIFGLHRDYALGNLHQQRIAELAQRWRDDVGPRYGALCRRVATTLSDDPRGLFRDWQQAVATRARREARVPVESLGKRPPGGVSARVY